MKKQWREIAGFENLYWVSTDGEVRNGRKNMALTKTQKSGKLRVSLTKDASAKKYSLHLLVLETFIGPCPIGMEAQYVDGNIYNNKLSNLRWGEKLSYKEKELGVNQETYDRIKEEAVIGVRTPEQVGRILNLPLETVLRVQYGKHWKAMLS
jgi:hypothetical protein